MEAVISIRLFSLLNSLRGQNRIFKTHDTVGAMKLNHLSDQALLQKTLLLVKKEKEILSEILLHLQEVHKRRLYCELGFGSLFQYCVKHLGYSEDQTYRRINALKLVKEIPSVQEQIASGELSLSTLSVAQSLFKVDANVNKKELRLSLSQAQEEKWIAVKAKLAHCNLKEEEILERLCDLLLKSEPKPAGKIKPNNQPAQGKKPAPPRSSASPTVKNISVQTKRAVRARAGNKCSNCGSIFALQIDHKLPRALGGTNQPQNLRLLCRACSVRPSRFLE